MRFHRALAGEGEAPWQWAVSQVCEAFACLPSQALAELGEPGELPEGLIEDVLLLRAYREQWQYRQRAKRGEKGIMPDDYPLVTKVELWIGEAKRRAAREGQ